MNEIPQYLKDLGFNWRLANPEDLQFVVKSWLSSFKKPFRTGSGSGPYGEYQEVIDEERQSKDSRAIKLLDKLYYTQTNLIIALILYTNIPLIVYDEQNPTVIIAWGVGSDYALHYCYTKLLFRRQGIATAIIKALCTKIPETTFMTEVGSKLLEHAKQ